VLDGRASTEQGRGRIDHAVQRIRLGPARKIAESMLPRAMRDFDEELARGRT
jgi:hypothetical protein